MFINGIGTAVPERRFSQQECWDALQNFEQFRCLSSRSRAILRKVLTSKNGVEFRSLALDKLEEAFDLTPDALHRRFAKHAPALAIQAGAQALDKAGIARADVDALLVSTCTGYLCPGLTSYVVEGLGLSSNILCLDLVGQGCGAAMPNLSTGETLLKSGRCKNVLSVCVEVCSAAFYLDDDPGVLISACLFGDGAAAVVLGNEPGLGRKVEWIGSAGSLKTSDRPLLRFETRGGMLRNVLSPAVPQLASREVAALLASTLGANGLDVRNVQGWILHPGGRDVLEAVQNALGIDREKLRCSYDVLRTHGNLSSPSVLFVLDEALRDSVPSGLWWMSAFGAGFSCYGAMLRVS